MGHSVTVLTIDEIVSPSLDNMEGIQVWRVPGRDLTATLGIQMCVSTKAWSFFAELVETGEFDVVNTHNIFFQLSLVAALRTKSRRLPLVVTAHLGAVTELGTKYGLPSRLYEQTIGRYVLSRADAVTAVSQAVAHHVRSLGASVNRLTVIPNGVDTKRFSPIERAPQPERVIFVGRLVFNKGPQFLLEAAPRVLASFPETRFSFVGDGPMRDDLETRARELAIDHAVDFLGHREDVEEHLATSTVFVRPSLLEGFSLTILEAMSCGLPVIATPAGGTAEVLEDGTNGYLVQPRDVSALAETIVRVLVDPRGAVAMGRAGRLVATRYDWDSTARQMATTFEGAAERFAPG